MASPRNNRASVRGMASARVLIGSQRAVRERAFARCFAMGVHGPLSHWAAFALSRGPLSRSRVGRCSPAGCCPDPVQRILGSVPTLGPGCKGVLRTCLCLEGGGLLQPLLLEGG